MQTKVFEMTLDTLNLHIQKQTLLIEDLIAKLNDLMAFREIPQYVNLKQACELKGLKYTTATSQKWQHPCCGSRWEVVMGKKVWKRADVLEWLLVTDETLEEYAKKMEVDISPWFQDGKRISGAFV